MIEALKKDDIKIQNYPGNIDVAQYTVSEMELNMLKMNSI